MEINPKTFSDTRYLFKKKLCACELVGGCFEKDETF